MARYSQWCWWRTTSNQVCTLTGGHWEPQLRNILPVNWISHIWIFLVKKLNRNAATSAGNNCSCRELADVPLDNKSDDYLRESHDYWSNEGDWPLTLNATDIWINSIIDKASISVFHTNLRTTTYEKRSIFSTYVLKWANLPVTDSQSERIIVVDYLSYMVSSLISASENLSYQVVIDAIGNWYFVISLSMPVKQVDMSIPIAIWRESSTLVPHGLSVTLICKSEIETVVTKLEIPMRHSQLKSR